VDSDAPITRALVLGGGGLAGIAWEVGVLVGLAEGGVDLGLADRVVGTSAGAVVGTLLTTGVDLAAIHQEHLAGRGGDRSGPPATLDTEKLGAELAAAMNGARDAGEMRARLGAWALAADTPPEAERREIIDARLPVKDWPRTDLRISAVDAETGELAVFTRDTRVELVDAVAASCAVPGVWPPMTAGKRRYVDGGVASIVHVARADDDGFEITGPADRVVVVAPLDPPAGGPFRSVGQEVDHRQGQHPDTAAVTIIADATSVAAFGTNVLDPATMPASAAAGYEQGRARAAEVAALWT
jgi:NTE family protein